MNPRGVLFFLGRLMLALAATLLVPAAVAYATGGDEVWAFVVSAAVASVAGLVLQYGFRQPEEIRFGRRDAFVLVSSAWVTASLVGALPFVLLKGPGFAMDAVFESASGFTTTGASILTDIEAEPAGLLLWRSLTHWLGGMGIIVLGIAVLPKLAVGGMELLGAEAPGPTAEKLTPRIARTAKMLWGIYALITALEVAVLAALGMGLLDAVNHAFATMATGGFSTRNASVAAFGPGIQIAITVFMVAAGANFALHFWVLRGQPLRLVRDSEFRFYIGVLATGTCLLALDLLLNRPGTGLAEGLLLGAFQATSIVTTTGFATADFEGWPHFSRALLFLMMFVGGCAGSTGGSVKVARVMIVTKKIVVDLKRMVQPLAVLPVRMGGRAIPEGIVTSVTTFFILFLALWAVGGLLLSLMGLELVTAFSASAACLGNVGPGFNGVGPTQNFAWMPAPAKALLVLLMIVGRLEIYTMLVLIFVRGRLGGRIR